MGGLLGGQRVCWPPLKLLGGLARLKLDSLYPLLLIPRYVYSVFSEHEKGASGQTECCTALLMIGFHSFS